MIKSKLCIILTISILLSNTAWAKFCSECGKSLPSDTAKFCSECGAKTNVSAPSEVKDTRSIHEILEELLSPVDKINSILESSDFLTVTEKLPEYKGIFAKNKLSIDKLSDRYDDITKSMVNYYFHYWDVICRVVDRWTQSSSGYVKAAEEYRCKYILKYFYNVRDIWVKNGNNSEIQIAGRKLDIALKEFNLCNSKYMTVKGTKNVVVKGANFIILEVFDDKVRIAVLGCNNGKTGVGYTCLGGRDGLEQVYWPTGYQSKKPWSPLVTKENLLKRTNCKEDDLNTFKSIIKK